MEWDSKNNLLATCGLEDNICRVWKFVDESLQCVVELSHASTPIALTWSPIEGML